MKSKALLFLINVFFLACATGCKKDYPKDIPDWVKNDIKKSKRQQLICPKCDSHNPRGVYEYYESSYGIIYQYAKAFNSGTEWSSTYYDSGKNVICHPNLWTGTCPSLPGFAPEYRRDIYHSKY